jgi:acyl dehydratase
MGLYFEEYELGQEFLTHGRTVTESDVVGFAGLSGDFNPLHVDAEFAKESAFGARIAHGLLGLSILSGLGHELGHMTGTAVAFTNVDWRFKGPIRIGDTLTGRFKVTGKRSLKGQGLVQFEAEATNQRGEKVQEGHWSILFKKKESALAQVDRDGRRR